MKRIITIEGMSCGHCTGRVEKALGNLENVTVLEVSVDLKHAIVDVENVSDAILTETVEDAGYDVISIK